MSKIIDTKYKETYFNLRPLLKEEEDMDSKLTFWIKMNNMAVQNITLQKMKTA